MSLAPRALIPLTSGLLVALGLTVAPGLTTPAATPTVRVSLAASTTLCSGWSGCVSKGYSDAGYGAASGSSWWNMYSGHNCTNYVAYRMVRAGMATTRPFTGTGNAWNWGTQMRDRTDQNPTVGSVAWWDKGVSGAGSVGHVAYVEQVVSPTEIVVSEDSWGGDFHWRRLSAGSGWPSGFIHLVDRAVVNTSPVTVTGTAAVGQTLGSTPGGWAPAPSLALQWLADGVAVPGATGPTLKLTSDLAGKQVVLRAVATAAGFTAATADSAPVTVTEGALAAAGPPQVGGVDGPPKVGTVLSVTEPTFSPVARRTSVQWLADGQPIAGATGATYTLGDADVLRTVTAVVTGKRPGYADSPVASAGVGPVVAGRIPAPTGAAISGRALVGRTLEVGLGQLSPADATATYTWRRDGEPVAGASGPTYALTPADVGSDLSVVVVLDRPGWLPRRLELDRGAAVATEPTLTLKAKGGRGAAVVWFRVEAEGVRRPAGTAVVRVGRTQRTVEVTKGVGRLVLGGLPAGRTPVVVRWVGTETLVEASAKDAVRVRRG